MRCVQQSKAGVSEVAEPKVLINYEAVVVMIPASPSILLSLTYSRWRFSAFWGGERIGNTY